MNDNKTLLNIFSLAIFLFSLPALAIEKNSGSAVLWKSKGDTCYASGRLSEALEFYTKALDNAKRSEDEHTYYASIGNIGNIYGRIGDFKRSLHYYVMGYGEAVKNHDEETQWNFSTNIVAVCCMMKDTKDARAFFHKQMTLPIKDKTKKHYYFLNNQAYILLAEGKRQMAEYYFRQTRDFALERRMPLQYVLSTEMEIGKLMAQRGDIIGAMDCFRMVKNKISHPENMDIKVNALKEISNLYKRLGERDSSEKYRSEYLALSDSSFNMQQFNIANSKLFDYESKQFKERIDSLVSRNNLQLMVIVLFIIMVAGLTFLYLALRRKTRNLQDAQKMLVSKNEELMAVASNSKKLLHSYVKALDRQEENGAVKTTGDTTEEGECESEQEEEKAKDDHREIALNEEQRNRLLNSITTIMEDVGVISNSDFNLSTLADMVHSNTKYVSWVINKTYNKNFKTLLHEYRIREACRRLTDKEHYGNMTIQAIYEEVGYNSAASFIQAFKKVNGMTPSVYKRLKCSDGASVQ